MQSLLGTTAASTTKSPSWGHSDKRLDWEVQGPAGAASALGQRGGAESGAGQRAGQVAGHYGGERGAWVTENRERRARTGAGGWVGRGRGSAHHKEREQRAPETTPRTTWQPCRLHHVPPLPSASIGAFHSDSFKLK